MKSSISECKNLTVKAGVVLNALLTETICTLDDEFQIASQKATVTSGIRTAQKQLDTIIEKAKYHGLDKIYPEILIATVDNKDSWINAWGKLLILKDIVNPPIPANAPFDYVKPNGAKRKAGTFIDISNHMKAHSFDIARNDLNIIAGIVQNAIDKKYCTTIKSYLVEPVNNAVHIDCEENKLDKF